MANKFVCLTLLIVKFWRAISVSVQSAYNFFFAVFLLFSQFCQRKQQKIRCAPNLLKRVCRQLSISIARLTNLHNKNNRVADQ